MGNIKILKKQIKLFKEQLKSLEKENGKLKKKRQGETKTVNPEHSPKLGTKTSSDISNMKRNTLDLNKIQEEIENKKEEKYSRLKSFDSEEPMVEKFYHVANIIAKDVETDKQKQMLYDKCKLFDEIFVVLDKYVDDVVDVHVKLGEKGVDHFDAVGMSKKIKENLKVRYVDKIDYNPDRLKAPQQKPLEIESPNKNHPDFDPKIAKEKIESFLKDGKLTDVLTEPQDKGKFISVTIDDVEKMIPKQYSYILLDLKNFLNVSFNYDLKSCVKIDDRVKISDLVGNHLFVTSGDKFISTIIKPKGIKDLK